MKRRKEIFWGILFLLGAVFMIVNRLKAFQDIGVFTIFFTIVLVGSLIENIVERSFGGILFSLAFLGILYDRQLGIENLSPWTLLVTAGLGTIGLNMIFKKKEMHIKVEKYDDYLEDGHSRREKGEVIDETEGEHVHCSVSFNSATKYIDNVKLKTAELSSNFGSLVVYFDNAVLADGKAVVNADVNFGSMVLYIPKEWRLIRNIESSFGGVKEYGRYVGSDEGNTLVINGDVTFSGMEIHYI